MAIKITLLLPTGTARMDQRDADKFLAMVQRNGFQLPGRVPDYDSNAPYVSEATAEVVTDEGLPLDSEKPWRIGLTKHVAPGVGVSTVERYSMGDDPLPYETVVFGGDHDQWTKRYDTAARAYEGHTEVVAWLRGERDEPPGRSRPDES